MVIWSSVGQVGNWSLPPPEPLHPWLLFLLFSASHPLFRFRHLPYSITGLFSLCSCFHFIEKQTRICKILEFSFRLCSLIEILLLSDVEFFASKMETWEFLDAESQVSFFNHCYTMEEKVIFISLIFLSFSFFLNDVA